MRHAAHRLRGGATRSTISSDTISPATLAKRFKRACSFTNPSVDCDHVARVVPARAEF